MNEIIDHNDKRYIIKRVVRMYNEENLDYFKSINDSLGHHTGDKVLSQIGNILKGSIRNVDICARMGGEEFAIYLPQANLETALKISKRISNEINNIELQHNKTVTASFGISLVLEHSIFDKVYAQADSALYRSKELGRDRVEVYKSQ